MTWQQSCDILHSGVIPAPRGDKSKTPAWLQSIQRWFGVGPAAITKLIVALLIGMLMIIGLIVALIVNVSGQPASVGASTAAVDEFVDRIKAMESRVAQLETTAEKKEPTPILEPQIKKLNQEIRALGTQMGTLSSKQDEQEKSVARLASADHPSAGAMAALAGQLGTMAAEMKELQQKTEYLERQIQSLQARRASDSRAPVNVTRAAQIHKVRAGETLFMIARRYNTSITNLRRYNNLTSKSTIYIGQRLIIRPEQ